MVISKNNWILWDLEDIKLCKTIDQPESLQKLIEKHGIVFKNVFHQYSLQNIIDEYSKFPTLEVLTWDLKKYVKEYLIERTEGRQRMGRVFSRVALNEITVEKNGSQVQELVGILLGQSFIHRRYFHCPFPIVPCKPSSLSVFV